MYCVRTPLTRAPNVNVRRVCGARLGGGGSVGRDVLRYKRRVDAHAPTRSRRRRWTPIVSAAHHASVQYGEYAQNVMLRLSLVLYYTSTSFLRFIGRRYQNIAIL